MNSIASNGIVTNEQAHLGAEYLHKSSSLSRPSPEVRTYSSLKANHLLRAAYRTAIQAHAEALLGASPLAIMVRVDGGALLVVRSVSSSPVRVDGTSLVEAVRLGGDVDGVAIRSQKILGASIVPKDGSLISLGVKLHYVVTAGRLESIPRRVHRALVRAARGGRRVTAPTK
jgi:hypothetical protein